MLALRVFLSLALLHSSIALRNPSRRMNTTKASGNRGTGLSSGDWKLDGGVLVAGIDLDPGFMMYMTIHSISNDAADVSISANSVIFGSNLPGFNHLGFSYGSISWGLFGKKYGYHYEGELCTKAGLCLKALFLEENQQKGRALACGGPICRWGTTGNNAAQVAAGEFVEGSLAVDTKALVEAEEIAAGNRGTGLSPGDWKLDGGVFVAGLNLDSGFKMILTVHSISNDAADVSISSESEVFGSKLPGFSHLPFSYGSISWGLFGKKYGYHYRGDLCNKGGNCLKEIFFEENQQKGRALACGGPICRWGTTGNNAVQVA